MNIAAIPKEVARHLGHYVYLYVTSRGKVFYVGKGQGQRAVAHVERTDSSPMGKQLKAFRRGGRHYRIEILAYGLPDEATAFHVEAAAIDLIGSDRLTNAVRGRGSSHHGRIPLQHLVARLAAKDVVIRHPVIMFRANQLFTEYGYGITEAQRYEATRGIWSLSKRRESARYAFAVHEGVVTGVYHIASWHPGGTTPYRTRSQKVLRRRGRGTWEFVGHPAPDAIRGRYLGRIVKRYLRRGNQSPWLYENC